MVINSSIDSEIFKIGNHFLGLRKSQSKKLSKIPMYDISNDDESGGENVFQTFEKSNAKEYSRQKTKKTILLKFYHALENLAPNRRRLELFKEVLHVPESQGATKLQVSKVGSPKNPHNLYRKR